MGWNKGYEIFEATVVGAYDLGVLDAKLLAVLMEPYRGTDVDSGGSCDIKASDGKGVEQIVIETFGGALPPFPDGTQEFAIEDWYDEMWRKFYAISQGQFGWR